MKIYFCFYPKRYQYRNWTHLQRTQNAKYTNAPVRDPNEDVLYVKDNPAFIDDENQFRSNRGKTPHSNKSSNDYQFN